VSGDGLGDRGRNTALTALAGLVWCLLAGAVAAEDRPLTLSGRHSPSCSPKGDFVAYVEYGALPDGSAAQHLFIMDLDGRMTRRLSRNSMVWDPSFSPDGSKVVCCAIKRDDPTMSGLWVIDAVVDSSTMLWQSPVAISPFAPAFSPDGNTIAYVQGEDGRAERACLWTMDYLRRSREDLRLHESLELSVDSGLMWMPDSVRLRFLAVETRGALKATALFECDVKKNKVKRIAEFPPDERVSDFAMSPDGAKLAYLRESGGRRELVLMESPSNETRVLAQVEPPPVLLGRPYESDVAFTRDSAAVVYVSGTELRITDTVPGGRGAATIYTDACKKNLSDILAALRRYTLGHGGQLPSAADNPALVAEDPDFWALAIRTLLNDPRSLYCPADRERAGRTSYEVPDHLFGAFWDDVVATNPVVAQDREPFHGGKGLAIYADGTIAEIE
jgi:dipeptidyl aminopeptidase/acylaminoacyl peptidase